MLIVVGTCTRSCARVRVLRQSRARRSRVSACRGEAALRPALRAGTASSKYCHNSYLTMTSAVRTLQTHNRKLK